MTRARIAFHIFWQRHKKGGGGEAGVRGNRPHIPDPDCYDQVLRAERGYYAVNESMISFLLLQVDFILSQRRRHYLYRKLIDKGDSLGYVLLIVF